MNLWNLIHDSWDLSLEKIDADIKLLSGVYRDVTKLENLRKAFSLSLEANSIVKRLADTALLIGPAESEEINMLINYFKDVGPILNYSRALNCK